MSHSVARIRTRRAGRTFRRSGFTLIEALATLVLVGLVLPAALRGVMLAAEAGSSAVRRDRAIRLGESKLNELIVTGEWATGATSGQFGRDPIGGDEARTGVSAEMSEGEVLDGDGYTWEVTVSDWNDVSLQLLVMRVEWEERGRERDVTLSTVVRAEEE